MKPINPMYQISADDTPEAEQTVNGRCWLKVGNLGLLFDTPQAAEQAIDQWAHDLACIRNEVTA